jgi:CBS domain-containing protein
VLVVKSIIWSVSLGSGTSGGVLAPLLMIGGALGGLEARVLPWEGVGFWPLVSMGAILGGTMRSPLTAVIFALELTHDVNVMLPLLLAVTVAHGFTVLTLRRSILTEKVSRRGFHLSREYAIDPLEIVFAREAVRTAIAAVPAGSTRRAAADLERAARREQRLFPIVNGENRLVGVVARGKLRTWLRDEHDRRPLDEIVERKPVVAHADESLRTIVFRMAETGLTRMPVIMGKNGVLVGMLALTDLLLARTRVLEAERRRERVLGIRLRPQPAAGRSV